MYTGIRLLLLFVPLFLHFSFQFSSIKIFRHTFFRNCERRLKLGTCLDSGQMYRVYRNKDAAAYLSLYSIFFPIFKHQNFSSHFSQELCGLEG